MPEFSMFRKKFARMQMCNMNIYATNSTKINIMELLAVKKESLL